MQYLLHSMSLCLPAYAQYSYGLLRGKDEKATFRLRKTCQEMKALYRAAFHKTPWHIYKYHLNIYQQRCELN